MAPSTSKTNLPSRQPLDIGDGLSPAGRMTFHFVAWPTPSQNVTHTQTFPGPHDFGLDLLDRLLLLLKAHGLAAMQVKREV